MRQIVIVWLPEVNEILWKHSCSWSLVFYLQEAASILETIYSEYANAEQKAFLIQEFYGADFAFFKVQ